MSRSSTARWEQGLRSGKAKRLIYHAPWSLTDGSLGVDLVGYAGFSRRGRNTSFAALQEPKVTQTGRGPGARIATQRSSHRSMRLVFVGMARYRRRGNRVRRREFIGLVGVAGGVRAQTVALGCICPRSDRPVAGCRSRSRRAVCASVCARFAMKAGLVPTQVGDRMDGVAGGAPLVSKAA
jgi:hypothetical protein